MNLYELASRVSPDELEDHASKLIWKKHGNGFFAYLIRLEDWVFLRVSGCIVQLPFYTWTGEAWRIATIEEYQEVAQLWQLEMEENRKNLHASAPYSQQSFST